MDYREKIKKFWEKHSPKGAKAMTMTEFWNLKQPRPRHGDTWGLWKYDKKRLVVVFRQNTNREYEVDLEECTTAKETLDWIAQLDGKWWSDENMVEVVGCLVQALNDLLHLQENIVHRPGETRFAVKSYLERRQPTLRR